MAFLREVNNLTASFSSQMEDFHRELVAANMPGSEKVGEILKRFLDFKSFVNAQLTILHSKVDELESYSRRNCLVFYGIPETKGEETPKVAIDFINKEVCPRDLLLDVRDIDNCHRLGSFNSLKGSVNKPRPIIVKFVSYLTRCCIWYAKRNLKGKQFTVSESLTTTRLDILKKAKAAFHYKRVYTKDGNIMISFGDGRGSKKRVTTVAGLEALIHESKEVESINVPPTLSQVDQHSDCESIASVTSMRSAGIGKDAHVEGDMRGNAGDVRTRAARKAKK